MSISFVKRVISIVNSIHYILWFREPCENSIVVVSRALSKLDCWLRIGAPCCKSPKDLVLLVVSYQFSGFGLARDGELGNGGRRSRWLIEPP